MMSLSDDRFVFMSAGAVDTIRDELLGFFNKSVKFRAAFSFSIVSLLVVETLSRDVFRLDISFVFCPAPDWVRDRICFSVNRIE